MFMIEMTEDVSCVACLWWLSGIWWPAAATVGTSDNRLDKLDMLRRLFSFFFYSGHYNTLFFSFYSGQSTAWTIFFIQDTIMRFHLGHNTASTPIF